MNHEPDTTFTPDINPATGLPMLDDTWLDVCGNPYGTDVHQPPWMSPVPQDVWEPPWDAF